MAVVVEQVEVEGRLIWIKKDSRGIVEIFHDQASAERDVAVSAARSN